MALVPRHLAACSTLFLHIFSPILFGVQRGLRLCFSQPILKHIQSTQTMLVRLSLSSRLYMLVTEYVVRSIWIVVLIPMEWVEYVVFECSAHNFDHMDTRLAHPFKSHRRIFLGKYQSTKIPRRGYRHEKVFSALVRGSTLSPAIYTIPATPFTRTSTKHSGTH